MTALSPEEIKRYSRHIVLRGVGGDGQQKLKSARVLVIGAGGLGSPVIAYLAAAGIGTLGVVDHDTVSLSNLQRQMIHQSGGIGTPKAESAGTFVAGLNAHVEYVPHIERMTSDNAARLLAGYHMVIDGTDNFGTRQIVAEAAEAAKIPLVSGVMSCSATAGSMLCVSGSTSQNTGLIPCQASA